MRESIIFFTFLLFNFNLLSQSIKEKLQNNTWQTTVNLTGVNKMTTRLCLKTDTAPDFEINFTKNNIFQCTEFKKNKEYDINVKEIIYDSNYFTESHYHYIIKRNKIKLYTEVKVLPANKTFIVAHYYKIIAKDNNCFEFIPISKK